MIMRSLQPRFARHLMGFPQTDFGSLVQALYGVGDGISRGLWADSSPLDSKGKKSGSGPRPSDVGTIGMTGHRSSRRPPFQSQFLGTPYQMIQHGQYRPVAPIRPIGPTYLHPPPQPVYATQAPQRPPMQFHHQYRAPPPPRPVRQFTQLGMPPSQAFEIDIYDGLGWKGSSVIDLYEESDFVGYIPRQQIPRPFSLTPDKIYGPPLVSPVYLQHVPPMTPFILFPEEYRPPHRDVQIVTRNGRVAQPPPVDKPFAGIAAREEIRVDMLLPGGAYSHVDGDRATCIVFSMMTCHGGSNHVRPLFIDVVCSGCRVSSVLLDNGYA
ncbi:hypothetical protein AAG906_010392 [Vitis piasezkii]